MKATPSTHDGERLCNNCQAWKPFSGFSRRGKGYQSRCKECVSELNKSTVRHLRGRVGFKPDISHVTCVRNGVNTGIFAPDADDMLGKVFTRLTVIAEGRTQHNKRYWSCQCDCGNVTEVDRYELISGSTKSCGCYNKEKQHAWETSRTGTFTCTSCCATKPVASRVASSLNGKAVCGSCEIKMKARSDPKVQERRRKQSMANGRHNYTKGAFSRSLKNS